jgi:hypothetical protein
MDPTEVEQVLANWIGQATSRPGQLSDDVDPAAWVSRLFLNWWRAKIEEDLSAVESAVEGVRQELMRLGGWENKQLGEALHELTDASEALRGLRAALGPEHLT